MLKNIFIDNIIFDLQRNGGISVVWYELIRRLISNKEFSLSFLDNKNLQNFFRNKLSIPSICLKDKFISLSRYLPVSINSRDKFVFHSSYYRFCRNKCAVNVTTVHDFTYDYYRKGPAKWLHCWQRNRAIRHSDYVVCISENTKRDLLKFLPDVEELKIRVIYNGVSEDYYTIDNMNAPSHKLPFCPGSYLVFVGSRVSYKNFDLLKRVVSRTKYNLVIVGSKLTDEEIKDIQHYLSPERYVSTGFLSNEQLNIVYNHAAALVYPSAYEGFGIPVIEAQKASCPVIAYNGSSIPEIIGATPLLMKSLTEEELICKIEMLSDSQMMNKIRIDGLENAKRFSWEKMYDEYVKLYNEALG